MKLKRRLLSIFTAAAMSLTAIPFTATQISAADTAPISQAYGDVDCDGNVGRITDVILLSKHVAKKLALPSTSQYYANANCNLMSATEAAEVNVNDLKAVVDYLLGTVDSLPLVGNDVFNVFTEEEVTIWDNSSVTEPSTVIVNVAAGDYTLSVADDTIVRVTDNGNGTITLAGLNLGSTTVTATSSDGQTDTLKVNVTISMPTVSMPEFDVESVTINIGLDATVNVSDFETPAGDLVLSMADETIATAVNNNGVVTITARHPGTTTLTVTDTQGLTDTLTITILPGDIVIYPPEFSVESVTIDGNPLSAQVNVTDEDTPVSDLVISVADKTIATATLYNGVVTITGLADGTTTLTVTDEQGLTDTLEIIVSVPPTSVEQPPVFEVDSVSVPKDEVVTVNVTDDGAINKLRAKIGNSKIVSVSLSQGVLTVTGLSVGETTVTVNDADGLTAVLTVIVTPANIPTIAGEIRDITPQQYVAEMNAGWNLGNTFDAWNDTEAKDDKDYQAAFEDIDSEMSWGNPKTTKAMFETVKEQGFDFVRIPTTWHTHFIDENFTIDPNWMDRVQTVVNYALECDLKVILNTHHEGSVIIPTPENEAYDKEWITAVWNQIGERFADYGDALMFEGLNEPRTEGSQYEWNGGTSTDREVINRLNQTFVDVIRAQGGNNATRFLLVPTYAAGVDNSLQPTYGAEQGGTHFVMPTDPANHTIVEIHAYTPWNFAGGGIEEGAYDQVFDDADRSAISGMFDQIQRNLLDKGYAVILDEFGTRSTHDENNVRVQRPYEGTSRMDWIRYYTQIANSKGIPCCVWDDGGWFIQLDRTNLTWLYPEYIDAFIEESFK
jgi:endoglucanase